MRRGSTSDTREASSSCLEAEAASYVFGERQCWLSSARAATSKLNLCRAIRGRELSGEWALGEGSCRFHAVPGFEGPGKAGTWQSVTASL